MSHDINGQTTLTPKQIKYLRGIAHKLTPVVLIGKDGLTNELITAVRNELKYHELIKVKIGTNSPVDKKQASTQIPNNTESCLVQLIGKTLILYKANLERPKDKRIILPKA